MSNEQGGPRVTATHRSALLRDVGDRARQLVVRAKAVLGSCEDLAAAAVAAELATEPEQDIGAIGAKLNELGVACQSFDEKRIELVEATDGVLDAFDFGTRHIVR
jgi:hypothetical protein